MNQYLSQPSRLLDPIRGDRPILLVVAAPTEAQSVVEGITGSRPASMRILWEPQTLDERTALLLTGVGKANAAGAVGHALANGDFGAVVSIGIGGALPTDASVDAFRHEVGDIVRCTRSVFADEGVISAAGWQTMADRGFGPRSGLAEEGSMAIDADARALDLLADCIPLSGSAATVSTCSGTNSAAWDVASRSGCTIEAMEGAAVGLATLRIAPDTPFLEVRVISNRTGDVQRWDLSGALARLSELASAL